MKTESLLIRPGSRINAEGLGLGGSHKVAVLANLRALFIIPAGVRFKIKSGRGALKISQQGS